LEELVEKAFISKMKKTASDGKYYRTLSYKLDAIIAIGYGVNLNRSSNFAFGLPNT
jgi:hypothetical protein